ncbi:MAG: L-tyrosine/L-tryptophan isonitrile synthase family protein [Deltaproteobacteria bacterium]|nr:L-tyrosine/L-tryptophan isonitrile synthase family protein [Deltaproteobacteria bacterium]
MHRTTILERLRARQSRLRPSADGMYSIADPNQLPSPPTQLRFQERLTAEAANRWLAEAGYAARVAPSLNGLHRLVYEGGVAELSRLDLMSLTKALAEHRQHSHLGAAQYVAKLGTLLDAGRTDRTWTEGDRDRFDLLGPRRQVIARTAVKPEYLGAPFALEAVRVPRDQVRVDVAREGLTEDLRAYVDHVIGTFDAGDGHMYFPVHNQQVAELFDAEALSGGKTFNAQVTSSDRTVAMDNGVRLKLDLSRISSINATKPQTRTHSLRDMAIWGEMAKIFESDPILRQYAATQPEVVSFTLADKDMSNLARSIVPYPAHPEHPEGTIAVSLKSLLTTTSGESPLLRMIVENRPNKKQDALEYFVDCLIRPVVKVFRRTLDEYGVGLFNLHEKNLAFEATLDMTPTQRVVINDFGDVWLDKNLMHERSTKALADVHGVDTTAGDLHPALKEPGSLIQYGMNTLYDSLGAMTSVFSNLPLPERYTKDEVRNAVNAAIAQEMRFLRADTAKLLGTAAHPLGRFVHHVSNAQQTVLTDVIERVREKARDRRRDPSLLPPVVVVDLDLCAFTPRLRAEVALSRVGDAFGIEEFRKISARSNVPPYHREGFAAFLEEFGLRDRYPDKPWDAIQRAYCDTFFDRSLLKYDEVTAGLGEYVRALEDAGAEVCFITGRRESERSATAGTLALAGIQSPDLRMVADDSSLPTSEAKASIASGVAGEVVAVFDDMDENRTAILARHPNAVPVAIALDGFSSSEADPSGTSLVKNFEFDRRGRRASAGANASVESFLSGARSVADLALADMRLNKAGLSHAVTLSGAESQALIDQLASETETSGKRLAQKAMKRIAKEMPKDVNSANEKKAYAIYDLLTHRPYVKGSRKNWSWDAAKGQLIEFVERNKPVSIVLPSFPIKEDKGQLKAVGYLPDVAELGALLRIKELNAAIQQFHEPGLQFVVLMDGHHYRPHFGETREMVDRYMEKLEDYVKRIGGQDVIQLVDYDALALEKGGPELLERRARRLREIEREYETAFRGLDVGEDPSGSLRMACMRDPAVRNQVDLSDLTGASSGQESNFRDLFSSLVYMVKPITPAGRDPQAWSLEVLSDVLNVVDPKASPELLEARKDVLRRTWDMTIGYSSAIRVDRELKYSSFASDSVRATIHPKDGQYGFAVLSTGEAHLTPWHGTGVIKSNGEISTDFVVALQDQGFVPVYAEFLGNDRGPLERRQPFAMVPMSQVTRNGRLKPEFWKTIRLPKE